MGGDGVLHQILLVVGGEQAVQLFQRRSGVWMARKRRIADRATDESTQAGLGQHLARHTGIEVHVSCKTAPRSNHFGRCATASHANVLRGDAGFGWENGFIEPSVKWKTIAEVSGVQLHGKMGVPILETSSDQAFGAVDVLHHILVAVRGAPRPVGVEQHIAHGLLPAAVVEDRVAVADGGIAHGGACSP